MSAPLETALLQRAGDYAAAIDRLRDLADDSEVGDAILKRTYALREAVELVRCLRRLVRGRSIEELHAAFGAPGDFGYESAIGDALARTYRGEP